MSYCKTYSEVLRLSSEQYLKSSPLINSDPHYFTERWYSGSHADNVLRISDVLLQDLSEDPEAVTQAVFKV